MRRLKAHTTHTASLPPKLSSIFVILGHNISRCAVCAVLRRIQKGKLAKSREKSLNFDFYFWEIFFLLPLFLPPPLSVCVYDDQLTNLQNLSRKMSARCWRKCFKRSHADFTIFFSYFTNFWSLVCVVFKEGPLPCWCWVDKLIFLVR